ncbi:MAG: glycosyltransferase [Erysipelotrichaceae bacterium]|nr:glycosyltransferase [Erysipelotrichaceae bacterium]
MAMGDLISVIVPVYKVGEYLDECVQSIVSQTYKNLEIILVDDGSPDQCPEMCDKWANKDDRIRLIHKKNGGLSDARNAGLDIATGDYIAFVDSDDWIQHDMYERMLNALIESEADICACGIKACFPDKESSLNAKAVIGASEKVLEMIYSDTIYPVAAWNKLYKKELWKDFRFPVGKICEDAFTTYLLVHKANKIVQIEDLLYNYRIRENSIMTSSFTKKRMDEEEAWRKNYEFISKEYPRIKRKAFVFYLQKVNGLIHLIPLDQKKEYQEEYDYLYKVLRDNFFYILLFSKMNFKYRIKFCLDFIKL